MKPFHSFPLVLSIAIFVWSPFVLAETYKKGDEIEVFFLGEWRPATVADTNKRGEVLGAFEFAGTAKQQVFAQANVRYKYESGALARGRIWSDASG